MQKSVENFSISVYYYLEPEAGYFTSIRYKIPTAHALFTSDKTRNNNNFNSSTTCAVQFEGIRKSSTMEDLPIVVNYLVLFVCLFVFCTPFVTLKSSD